MTSSRASEGSTTSSGAAAGRGLRAVEAVPEPGWTPFTSPQLRDGLHRELLCGHCGVLLMLDGHRYDDHLWVGAEVVCHLCGSVNPLPQTAVSERN